MTLEWKTLTIPFTAMKPTPLPGHQAPLDRRHRWGFRSTDKAGNFWYRCYACHRRRRVVPLANLIARKMRDAQRATDDYLNETLFRT